MVTLYNKKKVSTNQFQKLFGKSFPSNLHCWHPTKRKMEQQKTNKIKNEYITVKEFIIMMKYNFLSEKIKLPDNIKCLRDIFY